MWRRFCLSGWAFDGSGLPDLDAEKRIEISVSVREMVNMHSASCHIPFALQPETGKILYIVFSAGRE